LNNNVNIWCVFFFFFSGSVEQMRVSSRVDPDGELSDGNPSLGGSADEIDECERGPQSTARLADGHWQSGLPQRPVSAR